jgi:hypothetical protein
MESGGGEYSDNWQAFYYHREKHAERSWLWRQDASASRARG